MSWQWQTPTAASQTKFGIDFRLRVSVKDLSLYIILWDS